MYTGLCGKGMLSQNELKVRAHYYDQLLLWVEPQNREKNTAVQYILTKLNELFV